MNYWLIVEEFSFHVRECRFFCQCKQNICRLWWESLLCVAVSPQSVMWRGKLSPNFYAWLCDHNNELFCLMRHLSWREVDVCCASISSLEVNWSWTVRWQTCCNWCLAVWILMTHQGHAGSLRQGCECRRRHLETLVMSRKCVSNWWLDLQTRQNCYWNRLKANLSLLMEVFTQIHVHFIVRKLVIACRLNYKNVQYIVTSLIVVHQSVLIDSMSTFRLFNTTYQPQKILTELQIGQ